MGDRSAKGIRRGRESFRRCGRLSRYSQSSLINKWTARSRDTFDLADEIEKRRWRSNPRRYLGRSGAAVRDFLGAPTMSPNAGRAPADGWRRQGTGAAEQIRYFRGAGPACQSRCGRDSRMNWPLVSEACKPFELGRVLSRGAT